VNFSGAGNCAGLGYDFRFDVRAFALEVGQGETDEVAQRRVVAVVIVAVTSWAGAVTFFNFKSHPIMRGGRRDAAMPVQRLQRIFRREEAAAGYEE
jgi:hypothetical protein